MLVLHILHILFARHLPPPSITSFLKVHRANDPSFILPILPALEKAELVAFLPQIIARLGRPAVRTGIDRLLNAALASPISQRELLLELHVLHSNKSFPYAQIPLVNIKNAIHDCLNSVVYTFSAEEIGSVIVQLSNHFPTPPLLIELIINTVKKYPSLTMGFRLNILNQLIRHQIWTDEQIWLDFIRCCELFQPDSLDLVCNLPPASFQDAIARSRALNLALRKLLELQPPPQLLTPALQELLHRTPVPPEALADDHP
jgi:hypothetical protein